MLVNARHVKNLPGRKTSSRIPLGWLGLPATDGRLFRLDTATLSVLGSERETAVVLRWNS